MTKKSYAIMGGSIWGNRGAEAMLMTVIAQIRQFDPAAILNVFTIYPEQDQALLQDDRINFLSGEPLSVAITHFFWALLGLPFRLLKIKIPMPRSASALRDSDVLLDIGGITFSDGRAVQLLYNVFTIWPAMLMGVPVLKLSQAMGPFKTSLNRTLARSFLPKCERVFTRGDLTHEYALELLDSESKLERSADIAFLFALEDSLSRENEELASNLSAEMESWKTQGDTVICIVPSSLVLKRSVKQGSDYPGKLLNLFLSTRGQSYRYVFLPNGTRAGVESLMNNDIIAINVIREKFRQELPPEEFQRLTWVDYDINTRGVRKIIGASDGLVASRFHAMVAGLSLCVPTMVVGWSHKYRETLADFGMENYAIDYKNTDLNLLKAYRRFIDALPQIKNQLEERIELVKASSIKQFDYLRQRVG